MTVATTFVKDPRVESWLKGLDVKFTGPVAIGLDQIDRKASKSNQARDVAIDPEAVEAYRISIRNGDELPALLTFKQGGKYVIIDGNNRLEAGVGEGKNRFNTYVVDPGTKSETITMLTVSANAMNGKTVSRDWRLHNAIYLINAGYTKDAAAAAMKLSVNSLTSFEKDKQAKERADALRAPGWNTLSKTIRERLARIRNDKAFMICVEAAVATKIAYKPSFGETFMEINKAASEGEALTIARDWSKSVIEEAKQLVRMGRSRGSTSNSKLSLMTGLGKVTHFQPGQFNALFNTDEDRQVIGDRIEATLKVLFDLQYRLYGQAETENRVISALESVGK